METGDSAAQSAPKESMKAEGSSPSEGSHPSPNLKRVEVFNKTPRRIAIESKDKIKDEDRHEYLVISPFSTRVLSEDALRDYDYQRWEREDLIKCKDVTASTEGSQSAKDMGIGCGFWLVVYLVVAILVPLFRTSIYTWIIFAALIVVLVVLVISEAAGAKDNRDTSEGKGQSAWKSVLRSILQVLNLVLFMIVVFGLSFSLFYLFSGGQNWITTRELTMEGLGRVIQYLFITIATLLPALMYFLFNRRQRGQVQENFIREVLRLDPGIRTITEAESKYLSLVQETFGTTQKSAFLFSSGIPILLCTLLIFIGWLLVLQPFAASSPIDIHQLENLLLPRANAVTFAFLGAYFFAISLVFRRYVRADLAPKTYTHIILRLLLAIILAWTLSAMLGIAKGGTTIDTAETALKRIYAEEGAVQPELDMSASEVAIDTQTNELVAVAESGNDDSGSTDTGGFSPGLLYLLAFLIGIFPETGVTVLRDLARNPLFTRMFPRLEEEHPLTRLDGINLYDRSRFMEEGIENIENLAHHNLISLMLSTRISTNRLVDMFDQAILYLHLGLDPQDIAETRKRLRAYGIRTATDLEEAYQAAKKRSDNDLKKFLMILDDGTAQAASLSRIQTILDTLRDDDWTAYLRNWRELSQYSTRIYTLKGVALEPLKLEDAVQKNIAMAY